MISPNKDINKNLTDPEESRQGGTYGASTSSMSVMSYTKTQKLITALYMVTDIMDKEEPIRNKLRTAGLKIISDIHNPIVTKTVLATTVDEIMSFLNIASTMDLISEMNCVILQKEFVVLRESLNLKEMKQTWLEEFLAENSPLEASPQAEVDKVRSRLPKGYSLRSEVTSKGHIGVQKGSTLMKAIKDMHDRNYGSGTSDRMKDFDTLKKQRRDNIIDSIKRNGGSATITDIKKTVSQDSVLANLSEKTLQRELMSMTKDGVLNRTGEKRWSKYLIRG